MRYPTRVVGDSAVVASLVVSGGPCRLVGVVGHNNHASADLYIQVHELDALGGDETPLFSVLAFKGLPYSFALPNAVDLDKCIVAPSTTLDTYTAGGANVTIQALLAG